MQLAAHLRSWSPDALAHLLSARPDLLAAADQGFDALAARAKSVNSVGRGLIGVDLAMFLVAQALAVSSPATADELDELLGTNEPDAILDALGRLAAVGLILIEDRVATPMPALVDLLDRPLGLGPSFVAEADLLPADVLAELAETLGADGAPTDGATARAIARRLLTVEGAERVLADAPPGTSELMEALTGERSSAVDLRVGHRYRAPDDGDPMAWLLRRGLLVPYDDFLAEPVRELVIARHGNGLAPGAAVRPIDVVSVPGLAPDAVTAAAVERASRTLEATEALLRAVGEGDVALRKSGGVGIRELRRLAKVLEVDPVDVGRLLELLEEAQLINQVAGALVPSVHAETWQRLARDQRWLVLVRAWTAGDRFLSVALSTGPDGKQLGALDRLEPVADPYAGRQSVLSCAASIADGQAFDPEQFAEAVVWHRPNLWGPGDPPPEMMVAWTVAEAELLGLVAMAAPTPALRALVVGDEVALDHAAVTLGADQKQFVLQGDLTAMALGPLDPAVAAPLGELGDRRPEAATPLFRFTEASIRRGFDKGWTADGIVSFLEGHALSGIPQPLRYLVADVERRYGSIRIRRASSVLITDDEALAVEVATTRRAARLGLKLVAPTVLVGPVEPHQLLDELRAEGFFPVLDGDVARIGAGGPRSNGDSNTANGIDDTANGSDSTANGGRNTANGSDSTADGGRNTADGSDSTADGGRNTADGGRNTADGSDSTANGGDSTADGGDSTANGGRNTADGSDSTANGGRNTADGSDSTADGSDNTDIGGDKPADWTGPVLASAALAGEVADVVAALGDEPEAEPATNGVSQHHRLHLLWNRPAIITHLRDGQLQEARGVVVAIDESVTLLNDTGIERVGLDAVVAVDDPSR